MKHENKTDDRFENASLNAIKIDKLDVKIEALKKEIEELSIGENDNAILIEEKNKIIQNLKFQKEQIIKQTMKIIDDANTIIDKEYSSADLGISAFCECYKQVFNILDYDKIREKYDFTKMSLNTKIDVLEQLRKKMQVQKNIPKFLAIFFIVFSIGLCFVDLGMFSIVSIIVFVFSIWLALCLSFCTSGFDVAYSALFCDEILPALLPTIFKLTMRNNGKFKLNDCSFLDHNDEKNNKISLAKTNKAYNDLSINETRQLQKNNLIASDNFDKLLYNGDSHLYKYISGIYQNVKFFLGYCRAFTAKNDTCSFSGVLLKIHCNLDYLDKVVITKKYNPYSSIVFRKTLVDDVSILSNIKVFADDSLNVYANNSLFVDEILTSSFVRFVNMLGSDFVYIFKNGDLYILKEDAKEHFELGNMKKPVDSSAQYDKFVEQFSKYISIIDLLKNVDFIQKISQEEYDNFKIE